ncbi:MAG: A24 family peptidase, partial [Methylocystis sp.]|nr:A24 family peptidase [Methylocystis sp.]
FAALVVIALFDARYFVIPDGPILALLAVGAATLLIGDMSAAPERVAAAILGGGALWCVGRAYEWLRGTPGLGHGDARLFAVAGFWLGVEGLASCLLYAVVSALAAALFALRDGGLRDARQPFPFGPHLALGFWLCWVVGPLQAG